MHGNVMQLCSDVYADYPKEGVTDLQGPAAKNDSLRVLRGGCWRNEPVYCRSASRYKPPDRWRRQQRLPHRGFRPIRAAPFIVTNGPSARLLCLRASTEHAGRLVAATTAACGGRLGGGSAHVDTAHRPSIYGL